MKLPLGRWEAVVIFPRAGMGDAELGAMVDPFISEKRYIFFYMSHVLLDWDCNRTSVVGSNRHCLRPWSWLCQVLNCTGMLLLVEYNLGITTYKTTFHNFVSDFLGLSICKYVTAITFLIWEP